MPPRSWQLVEEIHEVTTIQTTVEYDMEHHRGCDDEWRAYLHLHLWCRIVRGYLGRMYRQELADEVRERRRLDRSEYLSFEAVL
jgi:hypothetical protein